MLAPPAPAGEKAPVQPEAAPAGAPDRREAQEPAGRPRVNPTIAALAAALSAAAAAWMVGGLFSDFSAHFVALLGVAIGAVPVLLSSRGHGSLWQYLVVPLALVAGVALLAPDVQSGTAATVPGLIGEAVRHGGLLQPPVSFDPGWRFLLVVLFALVSAGAAGIAAVLNRPKHGVALPAVLLVGAAVIQPAASELVSALVSVVLVIFALTLAFSAELGRDGRVTASFELPRLMRAGTIAAVAVAGTLGITYLGFLFPQPQQQHVVPPEKPPIPPPQPDVPLFYYVAPRPLPLRLGVMDTYDVSQHAWLLPGYDQSRLRRVQPPAAFPGAKAAAGLPSISVTFTIADAEGHAVPTVAGAQEKVTGTKDTLYYDPLTQSISLADEAASPGLTYTVQAVAADRLTGKQLGTAPAAKSMSQYLVAPTPPNEVLTLLSSCSQQMVKLGVQDAFDKLMCVRTQFYSKVVAAGSGKPVDMPASRVAQMLNGGDASPYEIIAAEALLARWAGLPSRIGYGYDGGTPQKDGSFQIRPRDGAMWLEVYFQNYGWVPLYGTPPKAKPSTSQDQKRQAHIAADNRIQMLIYIPIRQPTVTLLFVYVRWWLEQLALPVLALLLLAAGHPWLFKVLRRLRRRRWAARHGLAARITVAYAEFRDRARDLTIGDPAASPLKFLAYIEEDKEHRELAWLVTRSLWGDLSRDLVAEDAEAAEKLAASVTRRLLRATPVLDRLLGAIARTSLREPYSTEVPNLWPRRRVRRRPAMPFRWWRASLRLGGRRRAASVAAAAAGLLTVLAGCGQPVHASQRSLDPRLVPASLGAFRFQREAAAEAQFKKVGAQALVSGGLMYSIHHDGATDGSVEVTVFKPDVDIEDINDDAKSGDCTFHPENCQGHEVFQGLRQNLGSGHFHRLYYRGERAYETDLPGQRVYVWFPPGKETMVLLDLIAAFTTSGAADAMFHALVDYEHNVTPGQVPVPDISPGTTSLTDALPGTPSPVPSAAPSPAAPSPAPSSSPGGG